MAATSLPRPAKGFTSARARKWILASALVTAMIYAVRHLVEGDTSPAPSTNAARAFLGNGAPPNFGQWAISYTVAFLGLSLLSIGAPEVAASLAIFMLAVTFLESGGQLATDLGLLEKGTAGTGTTSSSASTSDPLTGTPAGSIIGSVETGGIDDTPFGGAVFPTPAPTPQSVGATVKSTFTFGVSPIPAPLTIPGEHYDPHTGMYEPNG